MSLEERKKKCPRCGAVITFYPAISRKDNKTEICSDCGVIEAIEEYINHKNKLEVGMYVRTTYGIGKIVKAYIVYSDDGCLWHLTYMTDNPKIEVSLYTKELSYKLFGEVQKNHRVKYESIENNLELVNKVYEQELQKPVCYVPVKNGVPRNASLYDDHKFIAANYDILDLIQVGDYVNGSKVVNINYDLNYNEDIVESITIFDYSIEGNDILHNEQIKSIVTKEQFESMKYSFGEE